MVYEIDYIPVGEGEKSGDAISLRFGNLSGSRKEQTVIVIDGGFQDSGEQLVNHLSAFSNTNFIDLVISTHPDNDHASGLSVILEKCKVGTLFMHKPWDHAEQIKTLFKDGRITASGLEEKLEKSLQNARDLENIAIKKGVAIVEPFQGVKGFSGVLHILGPSLEYYENLLPLFKATPTPVDSLSVFAPLIKTAKKIVSWIDDNLFIDLLTDTTDGTSPENNTSTVIFFDIDGQKLLFTGDAGKTGLLLAADYADSLKIPLTNLIFLDVPHHGSKRNLSSKILKRINSGTAFISAPKDSPKHPAKKVTNALKKHNMKVFVNRDKILSNNHEAPTRKGWVIAQEEQFYNKVEE